MKTSELTGAVLDWAVATCEGYEVVRMRGNVITFLDRTDDGALNERQIGYSTDWAQGGPIIEREKIELIPNGEGWDAMQHDQHIPNEGLTPLIAAMRCYVASKLGDTVKIPDELVEG
jgi:hypothetical protein